MNTWKEINGWKLNSLMNFVVQLDEINQRHIRTMIREYGIRSAEEFIFLPPEHFKKIRGAGKMFFLSVKKALYQVGIPYDADSIDEIEKKISGNQCKNDALTKLRFRILSRDNFTCQYCGRSPKLGDNVVLHIDHKFPSSKGGEWNEENLITSCRECNLGKGDVILLEREKSE